MTRRDVNEGDVFRKGFATNALESGATTGQVPAVASDGQMEFAAAGGGSQPGTVLPVAVPDGVTVDTTTYDNAFGGGKLTTLVFPQPDLGQPFLAIAIEGDEFPRWVFSCDQGNGLFTSDGTYEPTDGRGVFEGDDNHGYHFGSYFSASNDDGDGHGLYNQTTVPLRLGPGASNISSGANAPAIAGRVGDIYIRTNPSGANTTIYRCTVAGLAGAATWVGIL